MESIAYRDSAHVHSLYYDYYSFLFTAEQ